jgi:hypothetical protein
LSGHSNNVTKLADEISATGTFRRLGSVRTKAAAENNPSIIKLILNLGLMVLQSYPAPDRRPSGQRLARDFDFRERGGGFYENVFGDVVEKIVDTDAASGDDGNRVRGMFDAKHRRISPWWSIKGFLFWFVHRKTCG